MARRRTRHHDGKPVAFSRGAAARPACPIDPAPPRARGELRRRGLPARDHASHVGEHRCRVAGVVRRRDVRGCRACGPLRIDGEGQPHVSGGGRVCVRHPSVRRLVALPAAKRNWRGGGVARFRCSQRLGFARVGSEPLQNSVWAGPRKVPLAPRNPRFLFGGSAPSLRPTCSAFQMDIRRLIDLLVAGRNADGGWGYYRGKKSRLEPTCWAVLALTAAGHDDSSAGAALAAWPARDGLLLERAGGDPNYAFHGLALLGLHASALEHRDGNRALLDGMQRVKGLALKPSPINRQDNSIQGWSWIDDTFSWVEPTAWCLLALKHCVQGPHSRIEQIRVDDAERLLVDRGCHGGGWNYGNSNMLGKELAPYVPTTAVALLALRDRAGEPAVTNGLAFLERHSTSERSAMALALAARGLHAYGHDTSAVRGALVEQLPITTALGNNAAVAAAVYALTND